MTGREDMEGTRGMKGTKRIPYYYLWYTFVFLLLSAGMFIPFLMTGRSMVWEVDGRTQYFPQLVFLRRFLLETLNGILHGNWNIRSYDFSIGMGDGISAAARVNRLDSISVFVQARFLGYFYTLLVFVRIYLSGIAFSLYCRYRKMEDRAILIGCIVYLSSGFVIRRVPMHPVFGAATIMLPLMLLGVERLLRDGSGIWLAFMTGGAFFAVYYYAYICTIAVIAYFLFRYVQMYRDRTFGDSAGLAHFLITGFRALMAGIAGAGMAACVLVPAFQRLSASDRVHIDGVGKSLLFYPVKYLGNLLLGFISPNVEAGYNTRLNLVALVIPVLMILIFDRVQGVFSLRLALLAEAIGLVIPAAGLVMGAFGNISNRWTFIIAFTLAFATVCVIQKGPQHRKITWAALSVTAVFYAAGTMFLYMMRDRVHISAGYCLNIAVGCLCLVATVVAFVLMGRKHVSYQVYCLVTAVIALISAAALGIATYLPGLGNVVEEFMKLEELPSFYDSQPVAMLNQVTNEPFCRADTGYNRRTWLNSSLYHDYHGIAEYNSIMNAGLQEYLLELENPGLESTVKILSMDGRAVCENLASVRFYLAEKEDGFIPFGFEETSDRAEDGSILYRNQFPLNFAWTYDTLLPEEEYEALSAAAKQQVQMRAAVLEQKEIDLLQEMGLKVDRPATEEQTVVVAEDDVSFDGKGHSGQDGFELGRDGVLSFPYQRRAGFECYVRLTDLAYEDANEPNDNESLTFINSFGKKKQFIKAPGNDYYIPLKNVMVYMGYSDVDQPDNIQIRLNGKGTCSISGLELVYIPMESYQQDVGQRNEGGCPMPSVSPNTIEGDLEDGDNRFVALSVLYSKGWEAEVDGEPVRLVKANRCYMGFYVGKGEHHFKLTYRSRLLPLSIVTSVLSFLICFGIWLARRRSKV